MNVKACQIILISVLDSWRHIDIVCTLHFDAWYYNQNACSTKVELMVVGVLFRTFSIWQTHNNSQPISWYSNAQSAYPWDVTLSSESGGYGSAGNCTKVELEPCVILNYIIILGTWTDVQGYWQHIMSWGIWCNRQGYWIGVTRNMAGVPAMSPIPKVKYELWAIVEGGGLSSLWWLLYLCITWWQHLLVLKG